MPSGNDPGLGDGLNTVGYRGSAKAPINNGFFFSRLDHYLNSNWRIDISDRYYRELQWDARQLSIVNGNPIAVTTLPVRQNTEPKGGRPGLPVRAPVLKSDIHEAFLVIGRTITCRRFRGQPGVDDRSRI
jgi:hypothetical protein